MIFRTLILALFLGVPVVNTAAPEVDSLASTSSFYTIRRDVRRCASPMCGGYFIQLVNQSRTRCHDGRFMRECYVASIEWNGQPEPQNDRALVRGSLSTFPGHRRRFGMLNAREVWLPASDKQASGTYFRVRDRGTLLNGVDGKDHDADFDRGRVIGRGVVARGRHLRGARPRLDRRARRGAPTRPRADPRATSRPAGGRARAHRPRRPDDRPELCAPTEGTAG